MAAIKGGCSHGGDEQQASTLGVAPHGSNSSVDPFLLWTLAVVTVLSAMGVTLDLNVHIWALVIVAFALLAVVGLALGRRAHGSSGLLVVGIIGALVVIFATYGSGIIQTVLRVPRDAVEIIGFVVLLAGAIWDWRLKKA